jgi:hypothetical protein
MAKGDMPWFGFTDAPPIGLRIRYRKRFVTLVGVDDYRRKDGTPSHVLHWRADDGQEGTTGLRSTDWARKKETRT